MVKYCEECKYAEPNLTIAHTLCTNDTMPPWFNVIVFEGRVACNKFEERGREKELTQMLQIKQLFEAMFTAE